MKAFTKCFSVLSLTVFCTACGGGGAGTSGPLALSANANLGALTVDGVDLEQIFDPSQIAYTAVVGFLIASIHVEVAAEDLAATLTVNGEALDSDAVTVSLDEGDNIILVQIVAANGVTTRAYTITVTRQSAAAFSQDAYIKASNTNSGDQFGYSVAISGDTLAIGARNEESAATGINGDQSDDTAPDSGAVYVFVRDAIGAWSQQAYIKASNTDIMDEFGRSVALSGDTLAVGAREEWSAATGIDGDQDDNSVCCSGAVYVFTRDAVGVWSQQAYIKASNSRGGSFFGTSVALSGETLAVGDEQDAVYVFTRDSASIWSQQAYIKEPFTDAGDDFGWSVALSGNTLAVGAPGESSAATGIDGDQGNNEVIRAGAAYVFIRDSTGDWSQQAYIKASNTDAWDRFGWSVALKGDMLAVGAPTEGSATTGINGEQGNNAAINAGAAYVFIRDSAGDWSQQSYVKASNTDAGDYFGWSVTVSNDVLAVGAFYEDSDATGIHGDQRDNSAPKAGAAYVFIRQDSGIWSQQAYIKASNTDEFDQFGYSIALSGDTLAVGVWSEDSAATGIDGDQSDNSALGASAIYTFGGLPNRNANLAALSLGEFELDQIFQPSLTDYTTNVGFLVASVHLDALTQDPGAVVYVNGIQTDADGNDISLNEGSNTIEIVVTASDGNTVKRYTLIVTRQSGAQFAQTAYVKASNTNARDLFGWSVAVSGDTMAVGAYLEDSSATGINDFQGDNNAQDSGAVYIFTRDGGGVWSQQAYIKASNTNAGDQFGRSIALFGSTLAVGAIGEASAATGIDGDQQSNGARLSGAVYVFSRGPGNVWSQQAYVKASNTGVSDIFGESVALSNDTLVVGAPFEDSSATNVGGSQSDNNATQAGAVYIFVRESAGVWAQQAYIKSSNVDSFDTFGSQVAISGETLIVSAPGEDSAATGINGIQGDNSEPLAGAVYVFIRDGEGVWSQQFYVKASNAESGDLFGKSIAISGDTLAVGASFEGSASTGIDGNQGNSNIAAKSGAVYLFTRDLGGAWSQQAYVKASNTDGGDEFGREIALSGDTLAVGARFEASAATGIDGNQGNGNDTLDAGAVYVFVRNSAGIWSQRAYIKASNTDQGDQFGFSVALAGDVLVVTSIEDDSAATGIDGDQGDSNATASGAIFVFQ